MRASEILSLARVDEWRSADETRMDDRSGYQRALSPSRLRSIADYFEKPDAVMPLGGLLNARSGDESHYGQELTFIPDEANASVDGPQAGVLALSEEAKPLWIVDMQHRLGGLRRAIEVDGRDDLLDFPITCTIADGLSKLEEIGQFELINTTQKKVKTDLARRLMAIQARHTDLEREFRAAGKLWEARGSEIADWLNHHSAVWTGRITPPNASRSDYPDGVARETSFVTSLKPILNAPLFSRMDAEAVAKALDAYWSALAIVFPEAIADPQNHLIQRTPGVFSLHDVFGDVVEIVRSRQTGELSVSPDVFADVLDCWNDSIGDSDFWLRGVDEGASLYGGMKGYKMLANELRDALPEPTMRVLGDADELG